MSGSLFYEEQSSKTTTTTTIIITTTLCTRIYSFTKIYIKIRGQKKMCNLGLETELPREFSSQSPEFFREEMCNGKIEWRITIQVFRMLFRH